MLIVNALRKLWSPFDKTDPSVRHSEPLSEDIVLYAIGDIHGCFDQLTRLYDIIKKDLDELQPARSTEIFLGDYIDRGPRSREVVDWLIESPPASDERICLMGNHEAVLLSHLDNPQMVDMWRKFGAAETFVSYGLPPLVSTTRASIEAAHQDFIACLPQAHRNFFETLPQHFEISEYFFAHAGVNPSKDLDAQTDNDLLWIREPFCRAREVLAGRLFTATHPEQSQNYVQTESMWIPAPIIREHLAASGCNKAAQHFLIQTLRAGAALCLRDAPNGRGWARCKDTVSAKIKALTGPINSIF
jgi:serine/threonine protein phosphatase 1